MGWELPTKKRPKFQGRSPDMSKKYSQDWFKGKFTGNHGFYHQI
jgi:hypothetical protein